MSADTVIHNLVVRMFFGFALAATMFVLLVAMHYYTGWLSTQVVLIGAGVTFITGIAMGPDRSEKVLDWFKLWFWMGSGEQ